MSPIRPHEDVTDLGKTFRLDRVNGKLMGVCGGAADYFGADATLIRIGFVAATLIFGGAPIIIYVAAGLIAD
jgi:phage shock protein PspC (stress-responsive transcriptional regulator)